MTAQPLHPTPVCAPWGAEHLRVALAAAHHAPARGGRRLHLSGPDREDLRQDILLVMLERSPRFAPDRGAWSTFVGLLARHVVADRVRLARRASRPEFLSVDLDRFASGTSATQQDDTDPHLPLDLRRLCVELPPGPRRTLRLLATAGDVAAARQASSQPCASFYRSLDDLRFWLSASGMRPHAARGRRVAQPGV